MATSICRFIKTSGERCGSPALRGHALCYHHRKSIELHRAVRQPSQPDPVPTVLHPIALSDRTQREPCLAQPVQPPMVLDFPALEDRESIQVALSMLTLAMANNRIEPKRATAMVYALQVASQNAQSIDIGFGTLVVSDTVLDQDGLQIAPEEETDAETIIRHLKERSRSQPPKPTSSAANGDRHPDKDAPGEDDLDDDLGLRQDRFVNLASSILKKA